MTMTTYSKSLGNNHPHLQDGISLLNFMKIISSGIGNDSYEVQEGFTSGRRSRWWESLPVSYENAIVIPVLSENATNQFHGRNFKTLVFCCGLGFFVTKISHACTSTYTYSQSYTCFVSNRIAGNLSSAFHNSEFSIRSGVVLMLLVMHRKSCLAETLAMFLVNPLDMHSSLRDSLDNRTYLTK